MYKLFVFFLTTCFFATASAQDYPFSRNYYEGFIILKNSTRIDGYIKWMPDQTVKLRFMKKLNSSTEKYAPEDLQGFQVDSFRFISLFNFNVYAEQYDYFGTTTKIKSDFVQLIDSGAFTIYLANTSGYNHNGDLQYYSNYVFQKKTKDGFQYAAYPIGNLSADNNKFARVKAELREFFKDYPAVVEKLRNLKQEEDFSETVDLMKHLN